MIMVLVWVIALLSGGTAAVAVSEVFSFPVSLLIVIPYSYLSGMGIGVLREILER